ncbi:hypothetical protein QE152_g6131 [Popillia japonica]|uniref:Uncharacterized protein n=1 Tax=Popillia japonica TaxID=7064 RepID=A0AAW1MHZ2_POPJA
MSRVSQSNFSERRAMQFTACQRVVSKPEQTFKCTGIIITDTSQMTVKPASTPDPNISKLSVLSTLLTKETFRTLNTPY